MEQQFDVRSFSTPNPWSKTKGWGAIDTIIIHNLHREEDKFRKINKKVGRKVEIVRGEIFHLGKPATLIQLTRFQFLHFLEPWANSKW